MGSNWSINPEDLGPKINPNEEAFVAYNILDPNKPVLEAVTKVVRFDVATFAELLILLAAGRGVIIKDSFEKFVECREQDVYDEIVKYLEDKSVPSSIDMRSISMILSLVPPSVKVDT